MYTKAPPSKAVAPLSPVEIHRFAPDLLCLSVTNGRFQPVNSWIVGKGPRVIFDASFPEASVLDGYLGLAAQGDLEGLEALVVTHFHRDHSGQMQGLPQHFGVPLYMTEAEWAFLGDIQHAPDGQPEAELLAFLRAFGLTPAGAKDWRPINYSDIRLPSQPPRFLRDGERIALGGRDWQVITGGGHSPCAASFLSEDGRRFVAGDQILAGGGPQITLWQPPGPDPLGDYFAYLDRLAIIGSDCLILPGHGAPFTDLATRITQIRQGHQRRLTRLRAALLNGPCRGTDLMTALYPAEAPQMFGLVLFGMTMAMTSYLAGQGALRWHLDDDGTWVFERA